MTIKKHKKRKKKSTGTIAYLQYLGMRVVGFIIQILPAKTGLGVARFLGRGLYRYYGRGRQRALENLQKSYPEKDDQWYDTTARRSFEYLAMMVFDVFTIPKRIHPNNLFDYIVIDRDSLTDFFDNVEKKQCMVMVTGHYGNFEALGYALAADGYANYSVGRPIDNSYIDKYLLSAREKQGQTIINKKGATEKMLEVLSNSGLLGLVADQNGSRKDIFVDFFGQKAATYKSIGLLAMQFDAPIVVGYCRRLENGFKFQIGMNRMIKPDEWKVQDNPLKWITQEYTSAIEDFIREDPEQYWWLHRRWKTRPPEERKAEKLKEGKR